MSYLINGKYIKKNKVIETFDSSSIDAESASLQEKLNLMNTYGSDFDSIPLSREFNLQTLELPEYKKKNNGKPSCKIKMIDGPKILETNEDGTQKYVKGPQIPKTVTYELKDKLELGKSYDITNYDLGTYLSDTNNYSLYSLEKGEKIDHHNISFSNNQFVINSVSKQDTYVEDPEVKLSIDEIPKDNAKTTLSNDGTFSIGGVKTKTGSIETDANSIKFILGQKKKKKKDENDEEELKQFIIKDDGYIETKGALNFKEGSGKTVINRSVMRISNALLNRDYNLIVKDPNKHIHDASDQYMSDFVLPELRKKYSSENEENNLNIVNAYKDHGNCGDEDDYLDDPDSN